MSKSYQRQKLARQELDQIWNHPETVCVIHYSCESFYDRPDGTSPRITSIAVRNLQTGQTRSFSIHKYGELRHIPAANLNGHYDELEKEMLSEFFQYALEKRDYKWVHWNMRDENYGFHAIELRLKILGEQPAYVIPDERKFDLSRILIGIYGKGYAGHPRLEGLMALNDIKNLNFKTGKEEADLFDQGNYVALHQSTLAKVDVMSNICQLAHENNIKTNTKFWQLHLSSFHAAVEWLNKNPLIILGTIALTIIGLWQLLSKIWE